MPLDIPLLRLRKLKKCYDDTLAVDDITFDILEGEIFGLLGPNGAGKTTTIHLIAGFLTPTAGEIELAGRLYSATPAERKLLGFVPQELAIYSKLTGRENLRFFGALYGLQGRHLKQKVDEMLELVGLTEHADRLVERYSGGMKRRINLAAGLLHSPRLLLLDEPTVGVDPQSRNHIFEGIRQLNRQGLTILYTSHYMEEVQTLCNRVGIIDHGKLIACDTVENLIAQHGISFLELTLGCLELSQEVQNTLQSLDSVRSVVSTPVEGNSLSCERVLQIYTDAPYQTLAEVVRILNQFSVPLLSLNIKRPTLEDVFLALTGKHLRD